MINVTGRFWKQFVGNLLNTEHLSYDNQADLLLAKKAPEKTCLEVGVAWCLH